MIADQAIGTATSGVRVGVVFHLDLAGLAHVQRRRAVAKRDFGAVVEGVEHGGWMYVYMLFRE